MSGEIKEIPIKDIELDELFQDRYLNRWNYNKKDTELLESIHTVGLILPIIVRINNNDENKYLLVKGYRRLKVKQILKHKIIMCKILELSDSDAMGVYFSATLGCKELTYEQKKRSIETFRGIMNDMDERGLIEKNRVKELEKYINNLEIRNKPPKKITGSYYCPICKHRHMRGQKYEDHKRYAE